MNDETRQEVIKAMAYGMSNVEIANFAEVTLDEIVNFRIDHATEIAEYKQEVADNEAE